jgi:hypothetical protein
VRFAIKPMGARLSIDGVVRDRWLGVVFPLSIGNHTVEVTPQEPRCCQKSTTTVAVDLPPSGKLDEEKTIYLEMAINPANVSLAANAPRGASVSCPDIGLTVSTGAAVPAKLREPSWTGTCVFVAPDRARRLHTVILNAGETKAITWPD